MTALPAIDLKLEIFIVTVLSLSTLPLKTFKNTIHTNGSIYKAETVSQT